MRRWTRFIRTTMMLLLCLGGLMWTTQAVSLSQPGNGRGNEAEPKIDVSPVTLSAVQPMDLQIQRTLTITNAGSDTLNWTITEASGSNGCDLPGDIPWLSILPQSGSISNEPPPGLPEVLPATADTYVSQGRSTANFGASLQMAVGYDGPGCFPGTDDEASRGLIQVDVSPIPSETSIVAATLNVHADFACFVNQSNVPVTTHRISENWAEEAVTWETQPSFAEAHGTITVTDVLTWYQLDVTDLVNGWLTETWPNHGIMLQGHESGGSNFSLTRFASREKADGTLAPYLRLTYAGEPNSEDVTVTFDSTGLTSDVYSGTLCINSNDEIASLITVPVELTVPSSIQYLPIVMKNWTPSTSPPPVNNPPNIPFDPSPAHNASNVDVTTNLVWIGGDPDDGDTVTYDVYLNANNNNPTTLICNDIPATTCDPGGDLLYSTDYYWKVVATDNHNVSSSSSIWHFRTGTALCTTPGAPGLVSPGNGTTANDATPTFDWNTASNATEYQLQLDNNANFSSPEIDTTTASSDYTPLAGLSDSAYFWQVRGHNTSNECDVYGSWSSVWSVTIDTTPPSPPALVSPSNGSTTGDTTPTFDWTVSPGTTQYQLQVDNNADFSSPEIDITTASTDYTTTSGLSDATYSWQVRASDAVGNWSNWSSVWSMTIATSLPTVAFNAATYSVNEDSESAPIIVTLSGPSGQTVSVNYATGNGTAIAGSDYTATSGTLSFDPNQTSQTFSVPITNDSLDEPDETVNLTLSSPVNATLGPPVHATLTIVDNDPTCNTPEIPSLISPSDGSLTNDSTPTFDWNPASASNEYQLQIDNDPDFSSPEIDITTASTDYTPTSGLGDGSYYWRVRGHNTSNGCDVYGPWSSAWSVTIETFDGTWSGTTSQELPISFTVANNQITFLTADYRIEEAFICTYTIEHYTDTDIIGDTFTVTGQGVGYSYTITGTFNSNTNASGDLEAYSIIVCSDTVTATWTATKQ